jgi:hypothetical protein
LAAKNAHGLPIIHGVLPLKKVNFFEFGKRWRNNCYFLPFNCKTAAYNVYASGKNLSGVCSAGHLIFCFFVYHNILCGTDRIISLPKISIMSGSISNFIKRRKISRSSEQTKAQPFLVELCAMLELPKPDPAAVFTSFHRARVQESSKPWQRWSL